MIFNSNVGVNFHVVVTKNLIKIKIIIQTRGQHDMSSIW